jgi:putative copper export protein
LPAVQQRVRPSLAGEMAVGLAVLLVAAFLVNSKPPSRTVPQPPQAIAARR